MPHAARLAGDAAIASDFARAMPAPPPVGQQAAGGSAEAPPHATLIKVYFATDRLAAASGATAVSHHFTSEWNKADNHLTTGVVTVSIPPGHQEGKVERPFHLWSYEFREDPAKHVVLTQLDVLKGDDFYGALRNEFGARDDTDRSALVFIHGFNVVFDDAAYRTAQISYDLGFHGVPMMYSWPSQGKLRAYDGDEETTDWSAPHLQEFLERVARESGAKRIHVIAHSMGNRVLTRALFALGSEPDIQPMFENVIMAAPDVNAYIFLDQLWPGIKRAAKRFTLYASSDDEALRVSKGAKGKADFQRLGEAGPKIVVVSGLDTIDASGIDTSLLGHSYVDSCAPVLSDVGMLIEKNFAPLQRKLRDRQKEGLAYWAFPLPSP
jgi:esterase/lipase superfamily enzyme